MSKKFCENCSYYNSTGTRTGYCNQIIIVIKDEIPIITLPSALEKIYEKLKPDTVYYYPLVHRDFGCILYEILKNNEYIN